MTAPESLLVEHPTDDIVVLKINRPQVRNALNLDVRVRLADEITRSGADSKVRCVIVTGSDVAFAAGADIGEMAEAGPVEVMSRNVQKYWRAIMDCPKPVIAAEASLAVLRKVARSEGARRSTISSCPERRLAKRTVASGMVTNTTRWMT